MADDREALAGSLRLITQRLDPPRLTLQSQALSQRVHGFAYFPM